jgi:hypothetical protein
VPALTYAEWVKNRNAAEEWRTLITVKIGTIRKDILAFRLDRSKADR